MTGSLISCLFYSYFVAVFQIGWRIDDQVLAADQSIVDARSLAGGGSRLDRTPDRLSAQRDENRAIPQRGRGHDDHRLRRRGIAPRLLVPHENDVGGHLRP